MEDWNGIARLIGFPDEKAMLERMYLDEELPVKEIARKLTCGPATIARRLDIHKITKRARGGANNSHQLAKVLFRMDQRRVFSMSDNALAVILECHPSTIYKYKRGVTSL